MAATFFPRMPNVGRCGAMLRKALWVPVLGSLTLLTASAHAGGWQEAHETSDDVRVEVGTDGVANIQHHLRFRVVAGHFKEFNLAGVDTHAELVPDAVLTPEKNGK